MLEPEHIYESDFYFDLGTHHGHNHIGLGLCLKDLKLLGKGEATFYEPQPFLRIGTAYHQTFKRNLRVTLSFDLEHSLRGRREIRSFQLMAVELYGPTRETGMRVILGFNDYGQDEIVFITLIPSSFVEKTNPFTANLWGIQAVILKRLSLHLTSEKDVVSFGTTLEF